LALESHPRRLNERHEVQNTLKYYYIMKDIEQIKKAGTLEFTAELHLFKADLYA
jgi:hypothetical protein